MDHRNEQKAAKKRPMVAFWNNHKKEIQIVTGVLGLICATLLAVRGAKYIWNATAFDRWFDKASLTELKAERDRIHTKYMNYTINDEHRVFLRNLLPKFDKRIHELEWDGKTPSGPAYHREHGFNLYKPD